MEDIQFHGIGVGVKLSGDAQSVDVLTGKTFLNANGEQTGSMLNRGAIVLTPGTSNVAIAQGYHNGSGYVEGDADLVASNIVSGASIFGVSGVSPKNLVGTLTTTGTYDTATYHGECMVVYNGDGRLAVIVKGGTLNTYENINFSINSLPSGVTQSGESVGGYASSSVGKYYCAVFSGVTQKVNITLNFDQLIDTYDQVRCVITMANAS